MSEPENFIARWARHKSEATKEDTRTTTAPVDETTAPDDVARADIAPADIAHDGELSGAPASGAPVNETPSAATAAPPAIDLSALPPIDSIVAGTDVRAFLQAGVPAELTRAALRRAWSSDPTIRDFIGLSENSWDFTAPGGVPGFGPLSAEDASRLMAEFSSSVKDVIGKAKDALDRIEALEEPAEPAQVTAVPDESSPSPVRRDGDEAEREVSAGNPPKQKPESSDDEKNLLQRSEVNIATQQEASETVADVRPTRRGHGGALPQ